MAVAAKATKQAHLTPTWQHITECIQRRRGGHLRPKRRSQRLIHRFDPATLDQIVRRCQSGIGMKTVAEEFGISDWAVRALLKSRGVPTRPVGHH